MSIHVRIHGNSNGSGFTSLINNNWHVYRAMYEMEKKLSENVRLICVSSWVTSMDSDPGYVGVLKLMGGSD